MRIVVIHSQSSTGAYYLLSCFVDTISKYYPNIKISVFMTSYNDSYVDDGVLEPFVVNADDYIFKRKKYFHIKILDNLINHFRKKIFWQKNGTLDERINKNFDVAIYTWCYTMEPLALKIPNFFINHDMIMTHFFGHHIVVAYSEEEANHTKKHIQKYIRYGCIPCFTTDFVRQDFLNLFPYYDGQTYVILNMYNRHHKIDIDKNKKVLEQYDIPKDYIIYPINNMLHKNIGQGISGYFLAKQKYPNLKMIITGYGLQKSKLKMDNPYYATYIAEGEDYDIKLLGFVDDDILTILISNARLLLNTSLCEAGCGSGLDAWILGVPTAISNIPSYTEQVEKLGVKTEFFNPRNSDDIAQAILRILDNPEKFKENAEYSSNIIKQQHHYKNLADEYVKIFNEQINKKVLES